MSGAPSARGSGSRFVDTSSVQGSRSSAMRRALPEVARWGRPLAVGLTVLFTAIGLVIFQAAMAGVGQQVVGLDIGHYLEATRRWTETGTPYVASQLTAPFQLVDPATFLHPPIALYLFAPFLVLPVVLWWVIPIGIVAWTIAAWRPAYWSWPIIAAILALSRFHVPLIVGNSDLWVWAAIAAGLRIGGPAILVVVKPSLYPFIAIGIRRKSWWITALLVAFAAIPFGTLWLDWMSVIRNAPIDLRYSLIDVPWLLVPILAWLARTRPSRMTLTIPYPRAGGR